MLYIVVYDITCDKRCTKIAKLLKGYGRRVQYSVFECVLPIAKYQELQQKLKSRLNLAEDNVRFYPLSQHTLDRVETWGISLGITPPPSSIVI
ncbi:MAG: CRISPR-associated endonuclease Cas2 [Chamaesiphon sp.]|nr:CRISPR-associated endonuclease Cas2 [Chamaesiphon sp.]